MNRKLLVVEERHSPMLQRNSRGGENNTCNDLPGYVVQSSTAPLLP